VRDGKQWLVDLLLLSVVAIWGFNFSIIKLVYRDIHPIAFNALRFTTASLAMLVLLKWSGGGIDIDRKDRAAFLTLGIVGTTIYQFLFVLGLQRTKAGNGGLFMALTPIFAYLIGVAAKRERFSRAVLAGIMLSLTGVSIIVLFGSAEVSFAGTYVGDFLMIASAFCWGAYSGGASGLVNKYGPIRLTVLTTVAGAIIMMPLSVPWIVRQNWLSISRPAWFGFLYATFGGIVYSYFVWAYALGRVGVAHTAIYSNITPIIALLGGWILLGEQLALPQIAGVFLVITGVFIVRARRPLAIPEE
jgi:drug/metabolite transporter (DMT)-like permease